MEDPRCPATPPLSKCPDTPPRAGSSKSSPSRWNKTIDCKDESRSSTPSRPGSPENCAICLGPLTNKSFTNSCCHQFCFVCLLEWSKVKAECPLCKVAFDSIIHNVRSQDDYDQYHVVRQPPPMAPTLSSVVLYSRINAPYHYPPFPRWLMDRHSFRSANRGFQGFQAEAGAHPFNILEAIPNGPPTRVTPRGPPTTSAFRRSIYERDLWARMQPDVTGRYRDCSPEFFTQNPAQLHRLIPFLNRELNVLLVNPARSAYVMEKILELLPRHSMTSTFFRREVASLIGQQYAAHFCHELRAFASSVYDIMGYDRHVEYHSNGGANVSIEVEDSDSDRGANSDYDDDDIQIIENASQLIASRRASAASASATATSSSSSAAAGHAEALSQAQHSSVVQVNLSSDSDSDETGDVEIVGFVKPRHERTPELITLSSPEHPGSPSRARHDEEASNYSHHSSDELICINLGSTSSAIHRWQDNVNGNSSDSSDDFSRSRHLNSKPRASDARHFEPISSESLHSASSSSEDEWKPKCSRPKSASRKTKRKHKKHSKSKHYGSSAGHSGSENESEPSSRGRIRSRTSYYSSQSSSRTSRDGNPGSRNNVDSESECQPSTSRGRFGSTKRAERKHAHPRTSKKDPTSVRSNSGSNTDHSPPRTVLRSAIVLPNHPKTEYSSRVSSENEMEESDHKDFLKRTSDQNHDSWDVADSNLSRDSLRHHHHRYGHSHGKKSPCNNRHHKRHDSESSDSKRKYSQSGKGLSLRNKKCSRKRRERSRTPDYMKSPKRKYTSPCSDSDSPAKSHKKKQLPLASSDDSNL